MPFPQPPFELGIQGFFGLDEQEGSPCRLRSRLQGLDRCQPGSTLTQAARRSSTRKRASAAAASPSGQVESTRQYSALHGKSFRLHCKLSEVRMNIAQGLLLALLSLPILGNLPIDPGGRNSGVPAHRISCSWRPHRLAPTCFRPKVGPPGKRCRPAVARGRLPAAELIEGALIMAGGILLLLPGFLSDIVACSPDSAYATDSRRLPDEKTLRFE